MNKKMSRITRFGAFGAAVVLSLAGLFGASSAMAIPDSGASPNTPGTWSNVGSSVAPGGTLSFTVGGFPPGELLNIKIDDGGLCSNTSHGACVVHQQRIPSSGVVSGYLTIPADTPKGSHWLRFLASAYIDPNNQSSGTEGYSLRSANFNVAAAGSVNNGGSGGGSNGSNGAGTINRGDAPVSGGDDTVASAGEVVAAPSTADVVEPTNTPAAPAQNALSSAREKTASQNETGFSLPVGSEYADEWVYLFAFSEPVALGWQQVDPQGVVFVTSDQLQPGEHRIVAIDVDDKVLGWAPISVSSQEQTPAEVSAEPSPIASESQSGDSVPVFGVVAIIVSVLLVAGAIVFVVLRRAKTSNKADSATDSGVNK